MLTLPHNAESAGLTLRLHRGFYEPGAERRTPTKTHRHPRQTPRQRATLGAVKLYWSLAVRQPPLCHAARQGVLRQGSIPYGAEVYKVYEAAGSVSWVPQRVFQSCPWKTNAAGAVRDPMGTGMTQCTTPDKVFKRYAWEGNSNSTCSAAGEPSESSSEPSAEAVPTDKSPSEMTNAGGGERERLRSRVVAAGGARQEKQDHESEVG